MKIRNVLIESKRNVLRELELLEIRYGLKLPKDFKRELLDYVTFRELCVFMSLVNEDIDLDELEELLIEYEKVLKVVKK